jgi:ATPase family associated with various cellular activities (AAA)
MYCGEPEASKILKLDIMADWMETSWIASHPDQNLLIVTSPGSAVADATVIARFDPNFPLNGDYRFAGYSPIDCPVVTRLNAYTYEGQIEQRSGAFVYRFTHPEQEAVEVLVLTSPFRDQDGHSWRWYVACLAAIPESFVATWTTFTNECNRLKTALVPEQKVVIIGGRSASFVPTVGWDEIVLPAKLKADILEDVSSFFSKGIDVYKRLNLKPFRKLLLAGVPGTGKTMLCSALAKWAIDQGYLVIYVSSAYKDPNDPYGSTFGKIEHALRVAAYSAHPTMILLEELDAYLHAEEKALVLNVLDGNESSINDRGTLLVSTTNYPEAIDERILKRPGRLDRIFIIPETRAQTDAEQMLRQYLGSMWQDVHKALVPQLIGYPGAFIREVAVYALTQCAYDDLTELSQDMLEQSFKGLKEQLDARDDFLTQRTNGASAEAIRANGH